MNVWNVCFRGPRLERHVDDVPPDQQRAAEDEDPTHTQSSTCLIDDELEPLGFRIQNAAALHSSEPVPLREGIGTKMRSALSRRGRRGGVFEFELRTTNHFRDSSHTSMLDERPGDLSHISGLFLCRSSSVSTGWCIVNHGGSTRSAFVCRPC